jgi:hypothetical protein
LLLEGRSLGGASPNDVVMREEMTGTFREAAREEEEGNISW